MWTSAGRQSHTPENVWLIIWSRTAVKKRAAIGKEEVLHMQEGALSLRQSPNKPVDRSLASCYYHRRTETNKFFGAGWDSLPAVKSASLCRQFLRVTWGMNRWPVQEFRYRQLQSGWEKMIHETRAWKKESVWTDCMTQISNPDGLGSFLFFFFQRI